MANPLRQLVNLVREVDRAHAVARGKQLSPNRRRTRSGAPPVDPVEWAPVAEVLDGEDGTRTIRVELPGVEGEDVDVTTLPKMVLTISGVGEKGAFRQNVILPGNLGEDETRAKLERGVLEVYAPGGTAEYPGRLEVESI